MSTAFEKETGIKVSMTRKSSGEIYAQIKAEAANPARRHLVGRHRRPAPAGRRGRPDRANTSRRSWPSCRTGRCGSGSSRRAARSASMPARSASATTPSCSQKKKLAEPKCWADLLKPEFKDEIQVANPNSSGTAYTHARDARAADGRGQGLRLPQGAAQEHQPVHQVGRGAGARPRRSARPRSASRSMHDAVDDGGRRRAGEGRRALRRHRLRDRLDVDHQGRAEPRQRQEVVRLGADARPRRRSAREAKSVPGAVEQERRRSRRRRRSSPRSS